MLHRTTSSRRRRASRSAASSSTGSPQRGTLPSLSARTITSASTRRASVAVGASDSSSRSTPQDDGSVTPNRSPRGSIGGDTSPRGSIAGLDHNRSPRNSLVPETTRTSPRNSLVPEPTRTSPRNSLVPEFNRSPRNSLVAEHNRSPRNSLVPDFNRSPRNSLVAEHNRSPRNSLVPEHNRSPRNSLVPEPSRNTRNSLVPDSNRSPRNSLIPDSSRSPRNSLVPDSNRSPRNSLVPDSSRSPRNSLVPETYNRSPRGSLVAEGGGGRRSPRGSIVSAAGIVEAAFERGAGFMDTTPAGSSRGTSGMTRSPSPYRMSVSARGAQINLGYSGGSTWSDVESRRASSNVSQVSADDRRHLCERTKLSSDVGLTAYGSVVYQLKDANMEASGTCDFVCRALRIVYKTVVVTVALVCLTSLPLLMLIMGVQFLRDCPVEPPRPSVHAGRGQFRHPQDDLVAVATDPIEALRAAGSHDSSIQPGRRCADAICRHENHISGVVHVSRGVVRAGELLDSAHRLAGVRADSIRPQQMVPQDSVPVRVSSPSCHIHGVGASHHHLSDIHVLPAAGVSLVYTVQVGQETGPQTYTSRRGYCSLTCFAIILP